MRDFFLELQISESGFRFTIKNYASYRHFRSKYRLERDQIGIGRLQNNLEKPRHISLMLVRSLLTTRYLYFQSMKSVFLSNMSSQFSLNLPWWNTQDDGLDMVDFLHRMESCNPQFRSRYHQSVQLKFCTSV